MILSIILSVLLVCLAVSYVRNLVDFWALEKHAAKMERVAYAAIVSHSKPSA